MAIEYRSLGKTGLRVSTLGFGGSEIGYQGIAQNIAAAAGPMPPATWQLICDRWLMCVRPGWTGQR